MKKIFGIIFLILCFGVSFFIETGNVLAEDVTYNIALEEGYTYGDIQDCPTYVYRGYMQSVNNTASEGSYNMCLYTTETAVNHIEKWYGLENYTCPDSFMDVFKVTVSGSNGATYYGFSCRKLNAIDGIEITRETILVGQSFQIPYTYNSEDCSIIEGDAGSFKTDGPIPNLCFFTAEKEGKVLIKAITTDEETLYYEYNIIKTSSSLADLDQNYFYGSVDWCDLRDHGYAVGGEKNFDNLIFCGANFEVHPLNSSIRCVDEGYEAFSLSFYSDGKLYYGYGCRKPKNNDVIDYIEKHMSVGTSYEFALDSYNTCSIVSGTAGSFDTTGLVTHKCTFTAEKEGIVDIKVVHNRSNTATYYRIIINANSNDTEYNSSEYKDLICDVKSVLTKKTPDLYKYKIGQIKLSGVLYDIEDIDCSVDIKCDQNDCEYILEQKLKNTANYCNEIYSQGHNYNDGSNYTSRLEECVQFQSFYSSLVTNGIIRDLSNGCKMLSNDFVDKLDWILDIIKIAGPILAVGLGTLDFVKVVASGDADKEMKNAFKKFGIRIVSAVLLFIVPVILAFLMDTFLGNQDGYDSGNPFCGIVDWSE